MLKAASYLFGIILGVWGIWKIKEHVINPEHTPLWDGLARLIAGGAMLALPYVLEATIQTMQGSLGKHSNTGTGATGGSSGSTTSSGLDQVLTDFMASIFGPTDIVLTFFGYVAGAILVMIGITRLMKSAQEGPRGPGGIGTIMTFIAGGALLSFSPMIAAASMSLFSSDSTTTIPTMSYTAGLDKDVQTHIQAVIAAMIQFVLLLGLVSFLRGIFIVRGIAEGSQHATMMSGMTHLIGGALAVNLGPLINLVESTLGLSDYGVAFS